MARAGVDSVALSSHYASRTLPAPARSWSRRRSDGHQDRRRDRARLEPVGRPGSWKVIQWAVVRARRRGGARGRRRVHGGALLLGPLKFRWTTCVRLDHLRALGPPYFVNQVVQRNVSGPTAFKWSKQIGGVTTCETPSHHARRSVGRSRCGTPEPPPTTGSRRSRRPPGAGGRRSHGPADPLDAEGPAGITTAPRDSTGTARPRHHFAPGGAGRLKEKALRVGVGVRPPGAKGDRAAQAASASIRARLPGGARRSSPRPAAEPDGARRRIPTGASRPWTRGS